MKNFLENEINTFLNQFNYDIRISHDARWIDQKCTIDVLALIADCIIHFVGDDRNKKFTVRDIWDSEYTIRNVQQIFQKPNPGETAENEYDKYFGQPIKLFSYSKLLNNERKNNRYIYTINNYDLLEFISIRDKNAFTFLTCYIEKVLKDSGIYTPFEEFFRRQNADSFNDLKEKYTNFTIKNTPINGKTECGRIFTKVLNPISFKKGLLGTERGRISKDNITLDNLLYNQKNWRDILSEKPKGITREEYAKQKNIELETDALTNYKIEKAKNYIREFNDKYRNGISELQDKNQSLEKATQIHHIFPKSTYPEIAAYYENLIALTPNQHFLHAHPDNRTFMVDKTYQYYCLIAKADSIKKNLLSNTEEKIYDFDDFKYVLDVGLETDEFENKIKYMDFPHIIELIDFYYDVA